ncbi:peptidoglycan editing factor PgeF [Devosia nitrariae]|uniref:Purine nucleoside phosphorylase n=1 Tax=Devosia nitrariae TaxID=2071872 RepID=A0ABQ5W8M3_9HYPH|nr:peptidoglycan editing factor PgeF [Devosia nitrariae]GLQ56078.1 laccase domain protein [Devosia nitrariae]
MSVAFEKSPALAALPRLRHGFFGRSGGVSKGNYASLNVSEAVGDDAGCIAENRARIAEALGFAPGQLAILRQVHSTRAVTLTAPTEPGARPEADAMVTKVPGVALAIVTADCAPILLVDPEAGVIGAAHAGWRGAMDGVLANTVAAMTALGAEPGRIICAVGPTISAANYEVGPQFMADFLERHPGGERHFQRGPGGREHFDLSGFVAVQLREAGVGTVEIAGGCTYGRPDRYFSHRHATHQATKAGRQLSVIGLV